jgi:hypothetical protein
MLIKILFFRSSIARNFLSVWVSINGLLKSCIDQGCWIDVGSG